MPTASVLIVFHKLNPFFAETVRSVLVQTFTDFELLLVDNGSGLTPDVLGEAACDVRIKWLRLPRNLGIPGGHNAGIQTASGEFIMLLDYDDVAKPDRLEKQVAALRADEGLGLISSCAESIDEDGRVIGWEFSLLRADEQRLYLEYAMPVVTPAFSGRRSVFLQFPYREVFPFAADYDFVARAAEFWETRGVPDVLFQYRHHPGQTTVIKRDSQVLSVCVIRLLVARRRRGEAENLEDVLVSIQEWLASPPPAVETYLYFSRRMLNEGFMRMAVFHARRAVRERRELAVLLQAIRIWLTAIWRSPREVNLLTRLFLLGPVWAHCLRPAGKNSSGLGAA